MANAIEILAENRIAEALAAGAFDGLAGRGRPIRLEDDAGVPPDWRTTFRLLRAAGFTPAWIELAREIRGEIERVRGALGDAARLRDGGSDDEAPSTALAAELNRRIARFNLLAPGPRWHITPLDVEGNRKETAPHRREQQRDSA